ncbi:hypothetical protein CRM22_010255 [Opisthorchis felineus]|uniref:BPTI/Kunitz inhibitor domain-containing protein n=1 Tax=Opisthorchis felineus TaxID=147828 RepID=A0A4S2L5R1_OPIFE|nr:hypothetical protein CRM22_010255 [Opisthorchis felineus]
MSAEFFFSLCILSSLIALDDFGTHALQVAKSSQPNSEAFERLIAWKKHKAVPNYCGQYADPGPCTSRVKRFYYDRDLGDCKEFTYSGCLGNSNNFETKESCKMVCIE